MARARDIIHGALGFRLNRLSPGEAEDADLFNRCLEALNEIVDELDGAKSQLFREILTAGTVTGSTGTLGTTWPTLLPGDQILGATTQYSAGNDVPLQPLTMEQYAQIPIKTTGSPPQFYAHDGLATVYFYPVPSGQTVTLRTRAVFSDFADLDTDYSMPKGYRSGFSALLAEKMAPSLVGGVSPAIALEASGARNRLAAQAVEPRILNAAPLVTSRPAGNILTGFR